MQKLSKLSDSAYPLPLSGNRQLTSCIFLSVFLAGLMVENQRSLKYIDEHLG